EPGRRGRPRTSAVEGTEARGARGQDPVGSVRRLNQRPALGVISSTNITICSSPWARVAMLTEYCFRTVRNVVTMAAPTTRNKAIHTIRAQLRPAAILRLSQLKITRLTMIIANAVFRVPGGVAPVLILTDEVNVDNTREAHNNQIAMRTVVGCS